MTERASTDEQMSSTPVCAACGCDPIYHRHLTKLATEHARLREALEIIVAHGSMDGQGHPMAAHRIASEALDA